VAVDPRDPQGTTAMERIFQVDLELPSELSLLNVGAGPMCGSTTGGNPWPCSGPGSCGNSSWPGSMSRPILARQAADGPYPERIWPREGLLDRWGTRARVTMARRRLGRRGRWGSLVRAVAEHGKQLAGLEDAALRTMAQELGPRLRRDGFQEGLVAPVFALVREVANRSLGQCHYDVQLVGGWILLQGQVAEMETGEGKTLTATLAAAAAAWPGSPCTSSR